MNDDFTWLDGLDIPVGPEGPDLPERPMPAAPAAPARARSRWARAGVEARRIVRESGPSFTRATRRVADAEDRTLAGLAPLVMYAANVVGDARPQTLLGLSHMLQGDLADPSVTAADGTVDVHSTLYRVLDYLETVRDGGLAEPRERFDSFVSDDRVDEVWQALRTCLQPASSARASSGNGSHEMSCLNFDVITRPHSDRPLEAVLAEVRAQTGLETVKRTVLEMAAVERMGALRRSQGLATTTQTRHMVFTGNPGTGKTTMARLMVDVLHATGSMPGAHLVEADRSQLVGEFLGNTAMKTRKMIDAALGGVLFIDEAYSLAGTPENPGDRFAQEAIDTLVKAMEDDRDDLVVILAGYPDLMTHLLASNPGLASRVGLTVHFPDYPDADLLTIFEGMARDAGYRLADGALEPVRASLTATPRNGSFGNARHMRRILEATIRAQAVRCFSTVDPGAEPALTPDDLVTLRLADTARALDEARSPGPAARRE